MKWKNKLVDLGIVKENTKHTFKYELLENVEIDKIVPGCGNCTSIVNFKDNILTVKYNTGSMPQQVKNLNTSYSVRHIITVTYKNGEKDTLNFTAKII